MYSHYKLLIKNRLSFLYFREKCDAFITAFVRVTHLTVDCQQRGNEWVNVDIILTGNIFTIISIKEVLKKYIPWKVSVKHSKAKVNLIRQILVQIHTFCLETG